MNIKRLLEIFIVLIALTNSRGYCKNALNLYLDSDKTLGIDFKFLLGECKFSFQEEKVNLGVSAFTDPIAKNLGVSLKYGHLRLGGSLSKLNNPLLSSSNSPFSAGISTPSCISASLPTYTSFSNPFSLFFQFGNFIKKDSLLSWKANCFYSPESYKSACSLLLFKSFFNREMKLTGQFTLGYFPYDENSISSWFTDELYYHAGNHFCINYQQSFEYKKFYTSFLQGIYESPFGSWSSIFRSDNKISTDHFIFTLSGLYNPNTRENTIITSSDKILDKGLQFRSSLQYKFRTGKIFPVFIKNAFGSYINIKLKEYDKDIKIFTASQITCPHTAISLLACVTGALNTLNPYSPEVTFDYVTFKINSSFYTESFIPGINASVTINPSSSYDSISTLSAFGLKLNYSGFPKSSASISINLNHKDGELSSSKFSASLKTTFSLKNLNVILKFSADTNI